MTTRPDDGGPMLPEVAESIRIADHYLAGAPPEYRKQCAKEILKAILKHAQQIAVDAISAVSDGLSRPDCGNGNNQTEYTGR